MWRSMSACNMLLATNYVTKLAVPLKMATIADVRESIPSLPDESHHPKRFDFPKRSFGKTKKNFVQQRASGSIDTWPSQKTGCDVCNA